MTLMRQLAEFVTQAQATELPVLDREVLRLHTFDTAVARLLGGACAEGRHLRKVFGSGLDPDGIGGVAGLVRMTEMDDIHTGANTTPSSVVAAVAFCLYPLSQRHPREVESAIYVGTELLVRFGKAMDGARALFKGFWPTRSGAALGACATACRMLGLSVERTEQALSLAVMTSAGLSGRFMREPSGRWIVLATAVATGVRMALAAREGFNGAENSPDGEWIANALGLEFSAEQLTSALGRCSVFSELSLKPYATARQSLAATEAMRRLVADGLDPTRIERVVVRVPTSHKNMISQPLNPRARGTAFVSCPCQVATAALDPRDLYDVERRNVLANAAVAALAARVEIIGDPALDRDFPRVWAAQVEAHADGRVTSMIVNDALGSPENRMSEDDLVEKARLALSWFNMAERANSTAVVSRTMFASDESATHMAALFASG